MSAADPDGRIAQGLSDRLTCLAIELDEWMREAAARFAEEFPELGEEWKP